MFTGIIEYIGKVQSIVGSSQKRLSIDIGEHVPDIVQGESIALDGICLTVESYTTSSYTCYASPHTVQTTTLSSLCVGSYVNLERALLPTRRLGVHFVTGHVDTTISLLEITLTGDALVLRCSLPQDLQCYVVEKGSVALQGISLTVASIEKNSFAIHVIPETQKQTTIQYWKKGDRLNLEVDILAKYVDKACSARPSRITKDFLLEHGFWR